MEKEKQRTTKQRYFIRKNVLAILILLMIFGYFGINLATNYDVYEEKIQREYRKVVSGERTIRESIVEFEDKLTEEAVDRMKFVEIYSFEHVVLGKEEMKEFSYIKDKDGNMFYSAFYRDRDDKIYDYALRVKRLKDYVEAGGTKVIFAIPPAKCNKEVCTFSEGLPLNDPSSSVDELLFWLNRFDIDTVNYAEYMPSDDIPYQNVFYRTDHHWTVEASFYATRVLVDRLNEAYDFGLDGSYYLDINNFTKTTYKNAMFGSMGRGAGACFAGLEDYEAYYPTWDMHFTKETLTDDGDIDISDGGYLDTLINNSVFDQDDLYENWAYSMYLSGIRPYEHIVNEDNPDGLKIFMVRDSYFSPVIAFMAPMVSQIDAVWSMEDMGDLSVEEKLSQEHYDCVIIEVYPYNINENAFRFFEDSVEVMQ